MKGAIRTDLTLSTEIVAIIPGIVAEAPLLNQILVLPGITILVIIGVYGLARVTVKLDDVGYWLAEKRAVLAQRPGKGLLVVVPQLMKVLSIVGVLVTFLVGGGIVVHGIASLHHTIEHWGAGLDGILASLLPAVANLVLGFIISAVVLAGVKVVSSLCRSVKQNGCTQRDGAAPPTLKAHLASAPAGVLMSSGLCSIL